MNRKIGLGPFQARIEIEFFVKLETTPHSFAGRVPKTPNVPPSLRMLGIEPQTKLNCEVLDASIGYEVRWAIAGKSIVTQLVAKLQHGEYMAFGLSGDDRGTKER